MYLNIMIFVGKECATKVNRIKYVQDDLHVFKPVLPPTGNSWEESKTFSMHAHMHACIIRLGVWFVLSSLTFCHFSYF